MTTQNEKGEIRPAESRRARENRTLIFDGISEPRGSIYLENPRAQDEARPVRRPQGLPKGPYDGGYLQ